MDSRQLPEDEPMASRKVLRLRRELLVLAVGLCHDAGIQVTAGDRLCWSYDQDKRTIVARRKDLLKRGITYCAGILAHEIGHYFISRYYNFIPPDVPSAQVFFFLLNCIEDPRAEAYIKAVYPGISKWLEEINKEHDPYIPVDLPRFMQFGFYSLSEQADRWSLANMETDLDPSVRDALTTTAGARRGYTNEHPPIEWEAPDCDAGGKRFYGAVATKLRLFPLAIPTPRERAVLTSAAAAFQLATNSILPPAFELYKMDIRTISLGLSEPDLRMKTNSAIRFKDPIRALKIYIKARELERSLCPSEVRAIEKDAQGTQLAVQLADVMVSNIAGGPLIVVLCNGKVRAGASRGMSWEQVLKKAAGREIVVVREEELPKDLRSEHNEGNAADEDNNGGSIGIDPQPQALWEEQVEEIKEQERASGLASYKASLNAIRYQVDPLLSRLERLLTKRKRMRALTGYPSGTRPHMRSVVRAEANPARSEEIWTRPTLPDRRCAAFYLLVDLSGSMKGAKSWAAQSGAILLTEVLSRLGIPHAIGGIKESFIPLTRFGEEGTPSAKRGAAAINEMAEGGNDDANCLRKAAVELSARPEDDLFLIVICDGIPSVGKDWAGELRRAIEDVGKDPRIRLIGLGIDEGTEDVCKYYPESRSLIRIADFAEEMGNIIESLLSA